MEPCTKYFYIAKEKSSSSGDTIYMIGENSDRGLICSIYKAIKD